LLAPARTILEHFSIVKNRAFLNQGPVASATKQKDMIIPYSGGCCARSETLLKNLKVLVLSIVAEKM
jgi:hypothetical protein